MRMRSSSGFTLIELVVSLSVFVIVFVLVTLFAIRFVRVAAHARIVRQTAADAAVALERMLFEIRHGEGLYQPTSDFSSAVGQLSIATTRNLPADEHRTYVDFFVDNGTLAMKREGIIPLPLTSDNVRVTQFTVTDVSVGDRDGVRVEITVEQQALSSVPERQSSVTMVGTATFRNE